MVLIDLREHRLERRIGRLAEELHTVAEAARRTGPVEVEERHTVLAVDLLVLVDRPTK